MNTYSLLGHMSRKKSSFSTFFLRNYIVEILCGWEIVTHSFKTGTPTLPNSRQAKTPPGFNTLWASFKTSSIWVQFLIPKAIVYRSMLLDSIGTDFNSSNSVPWPEAKNLSEGFFLSGISMIWSRCSAFPSWNFTSWGVLKYIDFLKRFCPAVNIEALMSRIVTFVERSPCFVRAWSRIRRAISPENKRNHGIQAKRRNEEQERKQVSCGEDLPSVELGFVKCNSPVPPATSKHWIPPLGSKVFTKWSFHNLWIPKDIASFIKS